MQQKPTLVIMAAGMGSRFGGLKQLTPVGPNGQKIIDYSIYDAVLSGFGKVVFVIKHAIEKDFKELVGNHVAQSVPVEYVYQELDRLPEGYTVPEGREKPFGTGHAILCCRGVVNEPFMVINADDFYGRETYRILADFLAQPQPTDKMQFAMAGYILENTLTENGYVSRGICSTDENGRLTDLVERTRIELVDGKAQFSEDGGQTYEPLPAGCAVSMNAWAFPATMLDHLEALFREFLDTTVKANPLKAEFYLPFAVNSMMAAGKAETTVLRTGEKWYGMTYAEDKEDVMNAIAAKTANGEYPEKM
ncbi:MAG: NTP transferase domain-containing protein [Clostridia bacterium]|nr:NTP transferase domain-containing protein [Clostridia bacterium]